MANCAIARPSYGARKSGEGGRMPGSTAAVDPPASAEPPAPFVSGSFAATVGAPGNGRGTPPPVAHAAEETASAAIMTSVCAEARLRWRAKKSIGENYRRGDDGSTGPTVT